MGIDQVDLVRFLPISPWLGMGWGGGAGGWWDLEIHIFPGPPTSANHNLFEHK